MDSEMSVETKTAPFGIKFEARNKEWSPPPHAASKILLASWTLALIATVMKGYKVIVCMYFK